MMKAITKYCFLKVSICKIINGTNINVELNCKYKQIKRQFFALLLTAILLQEDSPPPYALVIWCLKTSAHAPNFEKSIVWARMTNGFSAKGIASLNILLIVKALFIQRK